MSSYKRDDKDFRNRIAALAAAGLVFPTNPDSRVLSGRHINAVRLDDLVGETRATMEKAGWKFTSEEPKQKPKDKLPEIVSGLIWWSPLLAIAVVVIHYILRGAH